jgi:hypothetical protein
MGMMSELDIARQNGEFQVSDDDDFTEFAEVLGAATIYPSEQSRLVALNLYFSEAGHVRIKQMTPGHDPNDEKAYDGPYVDLPAQFAQPLRALLFGD